MKLSSRERRARRKWRRRCRQRIRWETIRFIMDPWSTERVFVLSPWYAIWLRDLTQRPR